MATNIFNKNSLHHAYVCEGDLGDIYPNICSFCEDELGFPVKANPDFVYEEWDKMLISHARRLHDMQLNKTTDSGRKIFIISFNFITREAQNALLKVLEEPTEGTHFFFITPSAHIFLDTVLSRVQVVSDFKQASADDVSKKFLKSNLGDRMKIVSKVVTDIKNEKSTKADALRLVRNVISLRHEEISKDKNKLVTLNSFQGLKEAEKVADYLYDNSASTKSLLEYFALIV